MGNLVQFTYDKTSQKCSTCTWIGVDGVGLPRLPVADDVIVAVLVVELQRLRLDELVRQLVVAVLRQTRHDTAHRVLPLPARHKK